MDEDIKYLKWCIERNKDNYEEINKWANNQFDTSFTYSDGWLLINGDKDVRHDFSSREDYKIIDSDYFRKFISKTILEPKVVETYSIF